ncbi:snapalysin [Kribbella qitaiheensis]|uniref:Extracellular small neutral protease n=1 Tax=Kribbella qitaiheensis TaxID=1544730 RepID=A0A7G6WTS7_9ACTN|nr:snapalysin [Kribbella qitaiheensis]QNE17392.1 snapalysin [Kribbella qitaiheensis]
MSSRSMLSVVAIAATAVALPVVAAAPSDAAPVQSAPTQVTAGYVGSVQEAANNKAFYDAVMKSAAAKRAKLGNKTAAVTVVYSTSRAPSFRTQIARSAQIWNNATNNVTLTQGSNYDFYYREGNDTRGSFASTDGHGSGYIFLDYQQNQQYDSTRVTAHETGHVLGLPDHYSGPCSELMSGGGPGTSCRNPYPNSTESTRVDSLWANGLTSLQH